MKRRSAFPGAGSMALRRGLLEKRAPKERSIRRKQAGGEEAKAELIVPRKRIPDATYRLQFNRSLGLESATELAVYLRDLGITDCYASPLFQAGPESTHGYDICGFDQISSNLGSSAAFDRFAASLRELGLGLVLDMVPNHMGNDLSNRWWVDVLENGTASAYASFFDIDWQPLKSDLHNKVLLPVLEDHYVKVLEGAKLKLMVVEEGRGLAVAYYDRRYPLAPESHGKILREVLDGEAHGWGADKAVRDLIALLKRCPRRDRAGGEVSEVTSGQTGAVQDSGERFARQMKDSLQKCWQASERFRAALERVLGRLNGEGDHPGWQSRLHTLLKEQHYRLAYWRVGPEEINYRRFFDITELVSLRMERPEVFDATHRLLASLIRDEKVTGLRIDHPDGLWNPKQYFDRLQGLVGKSADTQDRQSGLYVVAEKILSTGEVLPTDWQVDGTTGYDFLNQVNGIFVAAQNQEAFDRIYADICGQTGDGAFAKVVGKAKKLILRESMISELNALTHRLKGLAMSTRVGQDFTFLQLHAVLTEIIAAFPVYRTYVTETTTEVSDLERQYILQAVREARTGHPELDTTIVEFVQNLLLLRVPDDMDEAGRRQCREFVMRFQQLTGPVMAKGLEDTAFYRFNRLLSLNEVGGTPERFGLGVEEFHASNRVRAERWPHSMLATATHDTKRGEDARARLNVLSEVPVEWRRVFERWQGLNAKHKSRVNGWDAPDANEEYLLYQTLLGAWIPETEQAAGLRAFRERVESYFIKALKEGKTHTSWTEPNADYEKAARRFVAGVLSEGEDNAFLDDFRPFQRRISYFGQFNSLAQLLLKMTCPGIPDFYQGTELWDFNLVDPDNRRPVDYAIRRKLLADLREKLDHGGSNRAGFIESLLNDSQSGLVKVTAQVSAEGVRGAKRLGLRQSSGALAGELALDAESARGLAQSKTLRALPEQLLVKLFTQWRALAFRRERRELFQTGSYVPLRAEGEKAEHVCAFAREGQTGRVVVVVPRLVLSLVNGAERAPMETVVWGDTLVRLPDTTPGEHYRNVFTDERVPIGEGGELSMGKILSIFPVALLERILPVARSGVAMASPRA